MPAISRLRIGKMHSYGSPGANSLISAPPCANIARRSAVFGAGYSSFGGQASTATVTPPPSKAPECAAASMPTAPPLITVTPAAASPAAMRNASRIPCSEARRVPTMPIPGSAVRSGMVPRPYITTGRSGRRLSASGYATSSGVSTQMPSLTVRSKIRRAAVSDLSASRSRSSCAIGSARSSSAVAA